MLWRFPSRTSCIKSLDIGVICALTDRFPIATQFKGALVLGMAELYGARPDPVIYNYINTNLMSVVWNNIDNSWLAGPWWDGPVRLCRLA